MIRRPLVRPRRGVARRAIRNVRRGRTQQTLAAATAAGAFPLAAEIYVNHYAGSFANRAMWSPIVLLPALGAAAGAAVVSPRVARTWLPALAAVTALDGLGGIVFHGRGVARKPGGWSEPTYNVVTGPPLLAPGGLAGLGALGVLSAVVPRERW